MQNRLRWEYVILSVCLAGCGNSPGNGGPGDGGSDGGSDGGASGWVDNLPPPYTADAGNLTSLTPCPIPSVWPPPVAAATYDSTRKKVVIETALAGATTSDIWDWDGSGASFTSHAQCSANAITAGPPLTYDPAHQLVITYTPDGVNAAKNLVWEIDPTTGKATSHSVSPQASPSSGIARAFYDATLGGVFFVGSASVTYVWNATT